LAGAIELRRMRTLKKEAQMVKINMLRALVGSRLLFHVMMA
jgi:hypothetical protein